MIKKRLLKSTLVLIKIVSLLLFYNLLYVASKNIFMIDTKVLLAIYIIYFTINIIFIIRSQYKIISYFLYVLESLFVIFGIIYFLIIFLMMFKNPGEAGAGFLVAVVPTSFVFYGFLSCFIIKYVKKIEK